MLIGLLTLNNMNGLVALAMFVALTLLVVLSKNELEDLVYAQTSRV
jgi:hypothetical protein